MAFSHLYLLITPHAGGGHGKAAEQEISAYLTKQKISFTCYYSDYPTHIYQLIKEILQQRLLKPWKPEDNTAFPLLIVLGGDGTLHETINALGELRTQIPIGYIPCGSGNDFARGLGLPRKPLDALKTLLAAQRPHPIPIIQYKNLRTNETGYFLNNLGIGLDAAIVARSTHSGLKETWSKWKLNSLSYVNSLFTALKSQKSFPISVTIQNKHYHFEKTLLCTTTNHPYFGGGIMIAPSADIHKRNMDLVIIERPSLARLLLLIPIFFLRKHLNAKDVFHVESEEIEIESTTPQVVQADGEVLKIEPYHFRFTVSECLIWY